MDSDEKSLLVAGDTDKITAMFQHVEGHIKKITKENDIFKKEFELEGDEKKNRTGMSNGRIQPSQKKEIKEGVDILSMDV